MTQPAITTKAELLAQIDQGWRDLQAMLARFTDEQLTVPQNPDGWTIKDHVIHLMAWERSCVFWLQRQPRHIGLDIDEVVYLRGDEDEINAAIHAQTQTISLQDVMAGYRANHQTLLGLIAALSDAELQRRYRDFLPGEPGEGEGPSAINMIISDTIHHYTEHIPWIQVLAGSSAARSK